MNTRELVQSQIETSGRQVRKVLEGLPESMYTLKVTPEAMSPAETIEHLCECYQAASTEVAGGHHEWGNFSIADKSKDNLWSSFDQSRHDATQAVLSSDDHADKAFAYIVNHDAYHVGQLALLRMQATPDWDPYSLYEGM